MCVETCSEQPATSTAVGMAADRSCCTNRKLIYDFLLVINTNLPPILRRFQVMAQFSLARGECLTLTLLLGVIPANIPVIDISLKSGFFGLDFCRRKYRCILRKVSRDNFPPTIPPRENLPRPNKTPGNSPEFFPEQFPRHSILSGQFPSCQLSVSVHGLLMHHCHRWLSLAIIRSSNSV